MTRRNGRLVYGGRLKEELGTRNESRRFLAELVRSGRAIEIDDAQISAAQAFIEALPRQSDDAHIIALASASGARVLCSSDVALHADFKDAALLSNPRGKVYQNARRKHLRKHHNSCRVAGPRDA